MLKIKVQIREIKVNSLKRCRSEEHTSELQSPDHLVCRVLLEKKKASRAQDTEGAITSISSWPRYLPSSSFGFRPETRIRVSAIFFFHDTATTEIYTLSLHDALPI